jgi:hypothetical protein
MTKPGSQTQTTGHRYALKRLSPYMDGQLSERERARVQAHLKSCAECRDELRTLRWTQGLARQMPVMPVPRSFIVREADLETQRIARPRPLLVPALARLQTAAAIVAVLLVTVVAGDLFVRRAPINQGGSAPLMEAAAPQTATAALALAPSQEQGAPAEEPRLKPDTIQIESFDASTATPPSAMAAQAIEPTTTPSAEPSSTLPPRPTRTLTPAGQASQVASTEHTPTPVPTDTAAPTHTPTANPTLTPFPTETATPASDPPARSMPTSQPRKLVKAPPTATQEIANLQGHGQEPGGPDDAGPLRQWQGWRVTQITLGVVLAGLLVAIVWLRRWGRLG